MRNVENKQYKEIIKTAISLGLLAVATFSAFARYDRRNWFWKEFEGKCQDCGRKWDDGWMLEYDHMTPESEGGQDTLDNANLLCQFCHLDKHKREGDHGAVRLIQSRIDRTGGRRQGYEFATTS